MKLNPISVSRSTDERVVERHGPSSYPTYGLANVLNMDFLRLEKTSGGRKSTIEKIVELVQAASSKDPRYHSRGLTFNADVKVILLRKDCQGRPWRRALMSISSVDLKVMRENNPNKGTFITVMYLTLPYQATVEEKKHEIM